MRLPSERYALLLTDAVNSTRTNELLGDAAMSAWWGIHDRLARRLLAIWRGSEIDKSDGMLLLFDRAADAVGYALAYQRELAAQHLPFAMRAGLHVGPATLRRNSAEDIARGAKRIEVFGLALPTTARVMGVALGGQTLLSAEAARELDGAQIRLRSHGHWRLHGTAEPMELFEVGDDGTVFRSPRDTEKAHRVIRQGDQWLPAEEVGHNLPAERDSFVGRVDAVESVSEGLRGGARLISLLGVGGTGKTRLAIRVARGLLDRYVGGVWFCDLSAARTVEGIYFAVAQGLDVTLRGASPAQQLAQAIAGRGRCLVVLDNFEQVARHAECTLGEWLDRAPLAQFLVTTREVLGISGEQVLGVAPLNPAEAVELFRQRAASARMGYVPDAADAVAIEQLVNVLDGLPLAIELAAARTRSMLPRVLVTRMKDRFGSLLSRSARHDRQATLRAALDWSWDLLREPEKRALVALAVFEGGFTLDAAGAVFGATMPPSPRADDMVSGLLDKSWVRRAGDERFDLLETVRGYVATRLATPDGFDGHGAELERSARATHWRYFSTIGEARAAADRCVEANNLVAACRAATAAGDIPAACACLLAAWAALLLTGPYRVAVQLAEQLAARDGLSEGEQALVHWAAAEAAELMGDGPTALSHVERGLRSAVLAQATEYRARLLLVRGERLTFDGHMDAASADLQEVSQLAETLDHPRLRLLALNKLGMLMDYQSRWSEARDHYQRALAIAVQLGDRRMEGGILGNLGGLHRDRGDLVAARSDFERALELAGEVGDRQWGGTARCNLGLVLQEQGLHDLALPQFEHALRVAREVGHARLEYTALCNLGILLTARAMHDEAGRFLQQAVDAARHAEDRHAEGQFSGYLAVNLARRGNLEAAREALAAGDRLLTGMSDKLSLALLLCDRCEVERMADRRTIADESLGAAHRIASDLGCGADSELGKRLNALGAQSAGVRD